MPNICEQCGQEFYNDTDFADHQSNEILRDVYFQQEENLTMQQEALITSKYRVDQHDFSNILELARYMNIPVPEARDQYFLIMENITERRVKRVQEEIRDLEQEALEAPATGEVSAPLNVFEPAPAIDIEKLWGSDDSGNINQPEGPNGSGSDQSEG